MRLRFILLLALTTILALATTAYAAPSLASVTTGPSERCNGSIGNNTVVAQGGNITPMNISGAAQTDAWQGFYGYVSGEIILGDNTCDRMYDWSLVNLSGEVYLSVNSAVAWGAIAGQQVCTVDEALTGTGSDRVNRTFTNATVTGWDVGGTAITGACRTWTYVSSASQNVSFEEIILNDGTTQYIYATKIYENTTGFDGGRHDYQIIVPDNTTSATTTYYVYVEFN